jgi:hypothetical protein
MNYALMRIHHTIKKQAINRVKRFRITLQHIFDLPCFGFS